MVQKGENDKKNSIIMVKSLEKSRIAQNGLQKDIQKNKISYF